MGSVHTLEGRAAVLGDINKVEWADRSIRKFRKGKCQFVHLEWSKVSGE